jgi:3-methylcrotonyl-CoA carboxylase alpha subunit
MRIIAAALAGAQAIHPGYGFLSENPDFVRGGGGGGADLYRPLGARPSRKMGLKDAAKALMEEAGVPVVPGYHGADQDPGFPAAEAASIGYPVLIKAVAGGGGKGMRLVEAPASLPSALASAKGEAQTAFGNDAVLIEKYVSKAPPYRGAGLWRRDAHAVHLFERDCSLQRRHQKVIEEAPAPGMTERCGRRWARRRCARPRPSATRGAGTVEFIVDGSHGLRPDGFWFMEMNTRLQVEHPVTEAITGVDLVEWQLRVAAARAARGQDELAINGHAFEARLYAEDVPKGFLPATGTLAASALSGTGARADSGVRAGDEISPFYDPMIAKIITHGPTRETSRRRAVPAATGSRRRCRGW